MTEIEISAEVENARRYLRKRKRMRLLKIPPAVVLALFLFGAGKGLFELVVLENPDDPGAAAVLAELTTRASERYEVKTLSISTGTLVLVMGISPESEGELWMRLNDGPLRDARRRR